MAVQNFSQRKFRSVYGLGQGVIDVFPRPVIAHRAPTSNDIKYQIGQEWVAAVNGVAGTVYFLSGVYNNQAFWVTLTGGAGSFTSLTVNPGPTNLSTVGNGAVTIGNAANTGLVSLVSGTGNLRLIGNGNTIAIGNDAAANQVFLGTVTNGALTTISGGNTAVDSILLQTAAAGGIQIGLVNQTGSITLGNSTAGNIVNINSGINAGPQEVHIADGATAANSLVSILSGVGTAGAGTLALGNNQRVTTIGLGNIAPSAARTITVAGGNQAQNDTLNVMAGAPSANAQAVNVFTGNATGGTQTLNLFGAVSGGTPALVVGAGLGGNFSIAPATVNSATHAATLNARVGTATFTAETTIATGTQALVITNNLVTGASSVFVSINNLNVSGNGAAITIFSTVVTLHTLTVTYINNGGGALSGAGGDNVLVNFWVLN